MTKTSKCPNCKKPSIEEYKPFCSKRCADVDLGRWLNESYVIAGSEKISPEHDSEADYEDDA